MIRLPLTRGITRIWVHYKGETVCIEDVPDEERQRLLSEWTPAQILSLVNHLCQTINSIASQFDMIGESIETPTDLKTST